jgi:hypothetical protein
MGSAYSAHCSCGYEEHELMDGCGMEMQQYVVVACRKCHRLSSKYLGVISDSAESGLKNKRCGHCRSSNIFLYEVPENGAGVCPRCGKKSLAFAETMLWD